MPITSFSVILQTCEKNFSIFYLPHMEYEGSIGFGMRKIKFFIVDFHVLGLYMAKKHDLSDKKISSVTRRYRCRTQNLYFTYRLDLKC
jgi:hypothetical protein